MLELHTGSLHVEKITNRWYQKYSEQNYGAMITFIGIVRDEDGIQGLSFELYEPLVQSWFKNWQDKASQKNALVLMAHSIGDVPNHESSYIAAVCSPKRKVALQMIDEFVEDFKQSAPIWKYDIKNGQREYALKRSTQLQGAGLLS